MSDRNWGPIINSRFVRDELCKYVLRGKKFNYGGSYYIANTKEQFNRKKADVEGVIPMILEIDIQPGVKVTRKTAKKNAGKFKDPLGRSKPRRN